MLLGDLTELGELDDPGVRIEDVEASLLPLHRDEQPVEVREVGDVAWHAGDMLADLPDRCFEFRLTAAGDEDVGALGDEPPGGGQADAAAAPGNDRDLTFQLLRHGTPPLPVRAVRIKGCKSDCLLVGSGPPAHAGCAKPS